MLYKTHAKFCYHSFLLPLHVVALGSSSLMVDGTAYLLHSLNCNGSEYHLSECAMDGFFDNANCRSIATVFCDGM